MDSRRNFVYPWQKFELSEGFFILLFFLSPGSIQRIINILHICCLVADLLIVLCTVDCVDISILHIVRPGSDRTLCCKCFILRLILCIYADAIFDVTRTLFIKPSPRLYVPRPRSHTTRASDDNPCLRP